MNTQDITLTKAAEQLKIAARKLYAELRSRKILGSENIAMPTFVRDGYFRVEQRAFHLRDTSIQRQYPVTLVTPKGLSLLQAIVDEMDADKSVLPAEQSGISREQGVSEQSTTLQRMETNTEGGSIVSTARRVQ